MTDLGRAGNHEPVTWTQELDHCDRVAVDIAQPAHMSRWLYNEGKFFDMHVVALAGTQHRSMETKGDRGAIAVLGVVVYTQVFHGVDDYPLSVCSRKVRSPVASSIRKLGSRRACGNSLCLPRDCCFAVGLVVLSGTD
jgi:hypothetical protein